MLTSLKRAVLEQPIPWIAAVTGWATVVGMFFTVPDYDRLAARERERAETAEATLAKFRYQSLKLAREQAATIRLLNLRIAQLEEKLRVYEK